MALEVVLDGGVGTILAVAGLAARAGAKATVKMNDAVTTGYVTVTAKTNGYWANGYRVQFVVPDAANAALSVDFDDDRVITVSLATDGSKAATSTAALVTAALNGHANFAALFVAAAEGAGSGTSVAEGPLVLAGGVDAVTLATGAKFRVWSFDATNAVIIPVKTVGEDWHAGTDDCSVAVADLVTACTAP